MLGYAGATTSFPVIAADRDAKATAAWLAKSLRAVDATDEKPVGSRPADVREYLKSLEGTIGADPIHAGAETVVQPEKGGLREMRLN